MTLPLESAVTSPFGWRQDPFHGRSRFHAGVDLRAAYGQEVPAAAAGTVEFAGTQGAYGQTVVVAHDNGLRTRYAHLSSVDVEAGQRIAAGTLVGRAGSSGRSTGTHLHFEVTRDGKRLDPMAISARISGGLKEVRPVDDFPFDRVPPDPASGVNHED
jgi:murein DD-endopeptidase MepM/ murein hydrolase activator NlpD